ncbi:MAG TPA: DUF4238 domain-containing protein [Conexibacter sp.]|nr:DUF4238 domain-containing protein [Conexibacter sp.]
MLPAPAPPGDFAAHIAGIARGERPMPTAAGDRHHFVPEFLLRRFQGRTSAGRRLFVLDKTDGTVTPSTPKDAGWEHRLYAVDSVDGQHDGMIEAIFGLAENYASESLTRLAQSDCRFTDDDRGNIAYLIAAQEQRVPGALEELRRNLVIAGTTHAAVELANSIGSARRKRLGQQAYDSFVEGRVSMTPSPEAVLDMVLRGIEHTAGVIYRLPWTVLRTRADAARFIASDRPLTMFDPTPPHKFAAPAWLSSENVAAALPLSKSTCLRISPRDRGPVSWRDTSKQVERLNRFTYGFADRWVYGPSASALEAMHDQAASLPELFPTPIPKRMVLLEDVDTADPGVADRNAARGWDRYLVVSDPDGVERLMSYEVIDSLEDAMNAIAPRPAQSVARVETVSPTHVRDS